MFDFLFRRNSSVKVRVSDSKVKRIRCQGVSGNSNPELAERLAPTLAKLEEVKNKLAIMEGRLDKSLEEAIEFLESDASESTCDDV